MGDVRAAAGNRDGQEPGAMNHQGEVIFEHGGYRWRCQCGTQAQSVAATEEMAERAHRAHRKRMTKD
jgi:hypothetical protein